jgi:hypothetical protein
VLGGIHEIDPGLPISGPGSADLALLLGDYVSRSGRGVCAWRVGERGRTGEERTVQPQRQE